MTKLKWAKKLFNSRYCMWILILLIHRERKITGLQKGILNKYGIYSPHPTLAKVTQKLKDMGLVYKRKDGRKQMVSLTSTGRRVAEGLKTSEDVLKEAGKV